MMDLIYEPRAVLVNRNGDFPPVKSTSPPLPNHGQPWPLPHGTWSYARESNRAEKSSEMHFDMVQPNRDVGPWFRRERYSASPIIGPIRRVSI
jgi:hypothetical protein